MTTTRNAQPINQLLTALPPGVVYGLQLRIESVDRATITMPNQAGRAFEQLRHGSSARGGDEQLNGSW